MNLNDQINILNESNRKFIEENSELASQNKDLTIQNDKLENIIKKQVKKVRKLKEPENEKAFLLGLENLKTKWQRFGHVDASKIFVFKS